MILQVHDELLLEVPDDELEQVRELVIDTMSSAYALDVPLRVDTGTGSNWLEIKS
jgi:DNA polymerase-1